MRIIRSIHSIWRFASIGVGSALSITGASLDGWHAADLRSVGLGITIVGFVVVALRAVNRPADEAWSEGYEAGYDKGWRDCDRAPQLTVVPIRPARGAN